MSLRLLWTFWAILGVASAVLFTTTVLIATTILMNVITGYFIWTQVVTGEDRSYRAVGGALLRVGLPLFLPMWITWFIKFAILHWGHWG